MSIMSLANLSNIFTKYWLCSQIFLRLPESTLPGDPESERTAFRRLQFPRYTFNTLLFLTLSRKT